eukprot:gene21287-23360_t
MAKQQLKKCRVTKDELIPILEDIFGKVRGDLKVKGIVDCESSEEFEGRSEQLKAKWQKVLKDEDKTGSFITYFDQHISPKIKRSMLASARQQSGLGNPPVHYTQNANECINNAVKQKNKYAKQEWSLFLRDIFQLVQQQNRVVERAYLALGDYQLKQEFQHHGMSLEQWRSMTKDQQAAFINKLDTWSIKRLLQVHKRAAVDIAGPHESSIKGMIEDGHNINKTMNGVVPYPGDVTGSWWLVFSPPIASSSTAPDVACQTKVFKIEKTKTEFVFYTTLVFQQRYAGTNRQRKKPLSAEDFELLMEYLRENNMEIHALVDHLQQSTMIEDHQYMVTKHGQRFRPSPFSCPKRWSYFIEALSSSTPVCGLLHPDEELLAAIGELLHSRNGSDTDILCVLENKFPVLQKIIISVPNFRCPEVLFPVLQLLREKATVPFTNDEDYHIPLGDQQPSIYSCWPILREQRRRGGYAMDDKKTDTGKGSCQKISTSHPSLLPGIFTIFREHG